MPSIVDTTLRTDTDHLKWLLYLMNEYGIYTQDVSAIGLVGFMAHANTDVNNAVLYRSNQAIKESHVITAQRLSSLYKHAREVDIMPKFSVPATLQMVLLVEEQDFLAHATLNGDVYTYVITRDNILSVGAYIYSFDYDVEIRLEKRAGGERYLTARYMSSVLKNPTSNIVNANIKAVRQFTQAGGYIYQLYFNLRQYYRYIVEKTITDRDYGVYPVSTPRKEIDEIAAMEVFHIASGPSNAGSMTKLDQKIYFESSRVDTDTIFVNYDSAYSFQLIHKSDEGGFRPKVGDILRVELYCTCGAGGNYQYSDTEAGIKFKYADGNDLYVRPILLNDGKSYGGQSYGYTKEKLRKDIITKKSTRDSIVIENDIYMLLNNYRGSTNYNEYNVVKHRNDIIKIFNIFTTLKFDNNNDGVYYTIPTNTLHVDWDFVKYAKLVKNNGTDKFYLMTEPYVKSNKATVGEIIAESDIGTNTTKDDLIYRLPFMIAYDKKNNIVRAYDNYTETQYTTDYELTYPNVAYSYICNWIKFLKEDYASPLLVAFQVRVNLAGEKPKEAFMKLDPATNTVEDTGYIEVRFILKDKSTNADVFNTKCDLYRYSDIDDDDFYTYGSILIPKGKDKTIVINDKIELTDDKGTKVMVPLEGLEGRIEISAPTTKNSITGLYESDRKIINRFKFECDILKNRTSEFKLQHDVLGNDKIKMYHVPLVEKKFYDEDKGLFRKTLSNEYNMGEYLDKYQGEFSYSIKFNNTYGYSSMFSVGLQNKDLNNVVIDFNFTIRYKVGATLTERELNRAIYSYLTSINYYQGGEFHISNLYDFLLDTYPNDIDFIQFNGMNGLHINDQLIKMKVSNVNNNSIMESLNMPFKKDSAGNYNFVVKWTIIENSK